MLKKFGFLFLFMLSISSLWAQTYTEVYGKVIDAQTKEPMDYVNVRLVGVPKATLTDPKGEYRLRTIEKVDSIAFSYLGYNTRYVAIKRGASQQLDIEMGGSDITLKEVTVKVDKRKKRVIDTTANYVFYQVLKHKDQNRDEAINTYKYESYDKTEFSLLNPPQKFLNWWVFKPFRFAFKNTDTTEEGNVFIPGVLSEQVCDVYYRKHPQSIKKFVKASVITGVDNESVGNMANYHFAVVNPYDNLIVLAQTSFVSPFANTAIVNYFYFLTDTAKIDGRVSYKLHFVGKVKEDLALKGYAWIDSATWAIRSIIFRPNEKANFNFINDYTIKQDYTILKDKYWLMNREEMTTVGSLFKKKNKMAILVSKMHSRRNFEIDSFIPDSIFKGAEDRILADSARDRSRAYWDSARFEPLTPQQEQVYFISDTFPKVRAWKTYQWLGRFFTAAYADAGPISIGRVLNFGSRDNVEGWRVRFGFETNPRFQHKGTPANNFLRKFYFSCYGAYGLKDKDWKYMALMRFALPRKNDRWQSLEAMFRYDMRVPGQDENLTLITFDNIVNLITATTFTKIMKVREFRISYEKEYVKNFSATTSFNEKTYFDIPGVFDFSRQEGEVKRRIPSFNVSEFTIDTRYSYKDLYFIGNFYRYFQTTKYPVVMFRYSAGIVDMQHDFFNYHYLQFTLRQRLFSPIGYTNYIFTAGKIFGRAPYTVANITQGNLGLLLNKFNYNMLREFEFITDQYVSLWIEHNFDGFFLNKIPGINKLKLREVIGMKSLFGTFSKRNAAVLDIPSELHQPFPIPYIEMSVGLKNIAYMFRVDFLWRVTYRNQPNMRNWAIKFAFEPGF